jgi:uncharacterized membrane protein YfcA
LSSKTSYINYHQLAAASFGAGNVSGLLGIGGGGIQVPITAFSRSAETRAWNSAYGLYQDS